jgi:hypothetical protein
VAGLGLGDDERPAAGAGEHLEHRARRAVAGDAVDVDVRRLGVAVAHAASIAAANSARRSCLVPSGSAMQSSQR